MRTGLPTIVARRRAVLRGAAASGLGVACAALASRPGFAVEDAHAEASALIERLFGGIAMPSPRVRLEMPPSFGNGYSVPMTLSVDSPMTEADHVRVVHVLAPRNPIILVANFEFTPRSGRAAISTRVRLAEPQDVIAVAQMGDGTLLMARTWVRVDTNGCN